MKRRFDIGDRFCLLLAGEGSTFLVLLERLAPLAAERVRTQQLRNSHSLASSSSSSSSGNSQTADLLLEAEARWSHMPWLRGAPGVGERKGSSSTTTKAKRGGADTSGNSNRSSIIRSNSSSSSSRRNGNSNGATAAVVATRKKLIPTMLLPKERPKVTQQRREQTMQRLQLANPDHNTNGNGSPSIDAVDLQYLDRTLLGQHRFLGECNLEPVSSW